MIVRNYLYRWIKHDPVRYHSLHADMISARVGMTLEQYVWRSIKVALLTGIIFSVIGYFVSTFLSLQILTGKAGITNVFNFQMPVIFDTLYPSRLYPGHCNRCLVFYRHLCRVRLPAEDPGHRKGQPRHQDQPDPPQRSRVYVRDAEGRRPDDDHLQFPVGPGEYLR